jgi:hypothetical protein
MIYNPFETILCTVQSHSDVADRKSQSSNQNGLNYLSEFLKCSEYNIKKCFFGKLLCTKVYQHPVFIVTG